MATQNGPAELRRKRGSRISMCGCSAMQCTWASKSPEYIQELMAFMICILRASREYEGSALANYDAAFWRQAAATGTKRWSKINPSLHSICFTGKAKKVGRCDLCLSAGHPTEECSLGVDDDPGIS